MKLNRINMTSDASRGMPALKAHGTPAVFADAVRVDLAECSLLYISGKTPIDENHKLVGANMIAYSYLAAGTGYTARIVTNPNGDLAEDDIVTATGSYSVSVNHAAFFPPGRGPGQWLSSCLSTGGSDEQVEAGEARGGRVAGADFSPGSQRCDGC